MDNIEQRIKINGLKNGLLLGIIITALSIISYYLIISITNSPLIFVIVPILLKVFIRIFCFVFFCLIFRKSIGGYWTFRQATTGIFIMLFAAYLLQLVGKDIIFDKLIEPNNIEKIQKVALDTKASIMKQRGDKQQAIDKSLAELNTEFNHQKNITIGSTLQGIVFSTLFVFVFAIIFASLFKKDPPGHSS
jgi:hypothetical protein